MFRFAISDIHGCLKTFQALLDKIGFTRADELYLLGDYVDRGPDSKGVIDHILLLRAQGYTVHCLRGNHEELVVGASVTMNGLEQWAKTDGRPTFESFGVDAARDIPKSYLDFMFRLPSYMLVDEYILVHAGLDFDLPDPLSEEKEMTWIRNWHLKIRPAWLGERIIVHGHTPVGCDITEAMLAQLSTHKYLDIDTGCVFAGRLDRPWLGSLCAFNMTSRTLVFQENVE